MENFSNQKKLMNNIPLQNNYYKECKPLEKYRNNNNLLSISNNKTKGQTLSKTKFKVTYSNSIVQNKDIENRNIYNIINKNTNSSIGSIKEINIFNTCFKNQTNTSYNFYDKKAEKIIFNDKNSKDKIRNIKPEYENKKLLYSELSKSKSNKFKNRKRGPKSIYANKRPSMPMNKNKNKKKVNELYLNLHNLNQYKKQEENCRSNKKNLNSLSKLGNIYNTYNNDSSKKSKKNNLLPISLKHKNLEINRPFNQEIKKCQSQSYFKKYKINNEINTSISKKEIFKKSKSKNKSNNDLSYKGIIMNKKNLMRNNLINTNNNSHCIKNRILCINYNKSSNYGNIASNNNFFHFMNNIPEEYNKNPQFLEIKNLWNKLKVNCFYQEMFITLTKPYEDKKYIFNQELQNLKIINNSLNKINSDIKKRNEIIDKIRLFNINNNTIKNIEEMKKIFNNLRNITIETVLDYMSFFKEISYDIFKNKYNLNNIKNFNNNYLTNMKTDTAFLYNNDFFNTIFSFSNKSDPFLIYPSIKKDGYTPLPIGEDVLQKISKCRYFLLTEKISKYSLYNNKANINELLFNDQDNIINSLINSSSFNNKSNNKDNNINSEIKANKNISIFNPIADKQENLAKTEENSNKYSKFCYMNYNTESNIEKNNENYLSDKTDKKSQDINKSEEKNSEREKSSSIINNSIDYHPLSKNEKITKKILINEDHIKNEDINNIIKAEEIIVTPYISSKEISLNDLYNSYISSVEDNIKLSFDINPDIYYYSNIGIYPKLLLFKEGTNNNTLIGLSTISYSPNINPSQNFSKKILIITSISCQKGQKLSNILKQLINFCDTNNIIYDSIEIDIHYIKKEDGSYFLDKGLEKEIKSETKFKWVRLENNGEKRRIKYHYIKNKNNENIVNDSYINSIYINSYVLIKFFEEKGLNDITSLEYSKLYFIINLLKQYYLIDDSTNNTQDIENILTNLKGLKLKKIVRMLSDFSNAIQTNVINFKDDYCMNDYYNMEYLNNFIDILNKAKLEQNDIICLNYFNIITNFSNIIKTEIDGYEYNIISMDNYIVEVFNINDGNDESGGLLYFTKSEIDNISFIFYEFSQDDKISINDSSIKSIFNKILKKILVKDSEEPIKSYKKIVIPSFNYENKIREENNNNNFYIIKNEVLSKQEKLEFCQENNVNNDIKFSFSIDLNKNGNENNEIKIIKNNFILAVLNPDLVLDYHLPSMNIFYIDKSIWKKI